ncbi:MAG: hypothetical protein LAN64_18245 [Acidobacteriia bacterium]|nr:hypothetical protein [Terriglobia bacterium]
MRHSLLLRASLLSRSPSATLFAMAETIPSDDVAVSPAERAEEERLASIFRRVALGDTSVTDEVYWLQMQEDFLTRKR